MRRTSDKKAAPCPPFAIFGPTPTGIISESLEDQGVTRDSNTHPDRKTEVRSSRTRKNKSRRTRVPEKILKIAFWVRSDGMRLV